MFDLKTARKTVQSIGLNSSPGSRFRVQFTSRRSDMKTSVNQLNIPRHLPPDEYHLEIFEIPESGEEKEISHFDFRIPSRESESPPFPNNVTRAEEIKADFETSKTSDVAMSFNLLLQLREQDRISHENERQLWETKTESLRQHYEAETRRKDEAHKAEIERINKDWEYKLEMTRNNLSVLEAERLKMTKSIESRIRAEGKNVGGASTEYNWLFDLLKNPIVAAIAGKQFGIDPSVLSGLLGLTSGENSQGGDLNLGQIMKMASGFLSGVPGQGQDGKSILELIKKE